MRLKRKNINRAAAGVLAVLIAAWSWCADGLQTVAEDGDGVDAQMYLCEFSGEMISEIDFGAYSCLNFTLPRDEEIKIELWHRGDVRPLGCLYGVSNPVDMSNEGSRGFPAYNQKRHLREEELPERLETLGTQGFYQKASRIQGIKGSNILIWKGQYVPAGESYPRYAQPGSYEICLTPLEYGLGTEQIQIPVSVCGGGPNGRVTEEDIQKVLDREEELFPLEHMHVLDTLTEPENCRVNLLSGELFWQEEDFAAEEEGELPFSRYHLSGRYYPDQGRNITGLGDLWTHSYSYRAEIYRMDIMIYMPKGESISFSREYRKGWQPFQEGELPHRLDELEDGFLLHIPTGGSVFFDREGRATRIEQADGSVLQLSYYTQGRLYRVTTGTDCLTFWYKDEQLNRVENKKGETVVFQYVSGQAEVWKAVHPDERTFEYSYDEKHQLVSIFQDGELEMEAEFEYGAFILSDLTPVKTLNLPKEGIFRRYTYERNESVGEGMSMYREKNGGGVAVTYEARYGRRFEGCTWMQYDRRGNLIRSSEPSGETSVYEGDGL